MPFADRAVDQYLTRYAEPEAGLLESFPGEFRQLLVVPFYREPASALRRFCELIRRLGDTLLIVISNRPDTDPERRWHDALLAELDYPIPWSSPNRILTLRTLQNRSAVLLVDRVSGGAPIPTRQGVGLARKIGADIACRLIAEGRVHSPWIANTDADVLLPDGYFRAQQTASEAAALVYPFRHIFVDECPRLPTLLYEFSLHHYVEGLRWAGSPYAYHTLGSTIAVHYRHYAQVRGFPKRSGAEDFYLLNKLAKTGPVTNLDGPVIDIRARHSDRVPFGTGPGTLRIARQNRVLDTPLYHPAGFACLKSVLSLLNELAVSPDNYRALLESALRQPIGGFDADHLQQCCEYLEIETVLEHCCKSGRDAAIRSRHLHTWFDGFKTLKLINWLRERRLGSLSFAEWPDHAARWGQADNTTMRAMYRHIQQLTCGETGAGE